MSAENARHEADPLRGQWLVVRLTLMGLGAMSLLVSYTAASFGDGALAPVDAVTAALFLAVACWDARFLRRRWVAVRSGRHVPSGVDALDSGLVVLVFSVLSATPAIDDGTGPVLRTTIVVLAVAGVLVNVVSRRVYRVRSRPRADRGNDR